MHRILRNFSWAGWVIASISILTSSFNPYPQSFFSSVSPKDPWLVYQKDNRLLAVRPDGSDRRVLMEDMPGGAVTISASPPGTGGWLAVRYNADPWKLSILRVPNPKVIRSISLIDPNFAAVSRNVNAAVAAGELAWSPSGRYLAFAAAIDGPSADIYLYEARKGSFRRLTRELYQAYNLTWSPDGRWIVYQQIEDFGTGAGFLDHGVWAAAVDGSRVYRLFDYKGGNQFFAGWTGLGELVIYPCFMCGGRPDPGERIILAANPKTGKRRKLFSLENGIFMGLQVAVLPTLQQVALMDVQVTGDKTKMDERLELQIHFVPEGGGRGRKVFAEKGEFFSEMGWEPSGLSRVFLPKPERVLTISADGKMRNFPGENSPPVTSPDGRWLAFFNSHGAPNQGLRLYTPDGRLVHEVTQTTAREILWRPDSRGLLYLSDESLFSFEVPEGEAILIETGFGKAGPSPGQNLIWVQP